MPPKRGFKRKRRNPPDTSTSSRTSRETQTTARPRIPSSTGSAPSLPRAPARQPQPAIRTVQWRSSQVPPSTTSNTTRAAPEQPEANDDDAELDALSEIVMAVDLREKGTVGCSYYVAREEKLYFMEDARLGGVDIVDALKLYIEPTVVLVSTRVDDAVFDKLDPERRRGSSVDGSNDQFALPFMLEIRPATEFAYDGAKNKLVNLNIGSDRGPQVTFTVPGDVQTADLVNDTDIARQQNLLQLEGWVDMDCKVTVGCAGAVLTYLQRRRAAAFLPGDRTDNALFRVSHIVMFTLEGHMFMNMNTLLSLQIMQSESHPHSHNQGPTKASSGSKEGLSVYGLFHHLARTPQGKTLLRQYFLRPSTDLNVINQRLFSISVFLRPDNGTAMDNLTNILKRVRNMRVVMVNLRKGVNAGSGKKTGITSGIWTTIRLFAYHALKIMDAFKEMNGAEMLPICRKIFDRFDGFDLAQVGKKISEVIDFDQSAEQHRTVVLPGVDERLDNMKNTYDGIEHLLSQVARQIAEEVPAVLQANINVIFFPQIGFLTTVPIDPETGSSVYDGPAEEPWEPMFTGEQIAYYKNDKMHEMDRHFGDIHGLICDKEIEITHELAQEILEYEGLLTTASDICAELDVLLALAKGAHMYKLTKPRVSEKNVLKIEGGRHLLQELTVPSYVANNTNLAGFSESEQEEHQSSASVSELDTHDRHSIDEVQGPNMLIMTGPNYSGKSVYMKQVALIVYMAQIGSFVPAEYAQIGLTDKILTRIATRESVSRIQSAFMIDLQQISVALSLATLRSLLIIDEFGKGTESSDGAGLMAGVLSHLLDRGPRGCPKVLAATHFHEIFEGGFLAASPQLQFAHMQVRVDEQASAVEDQITYLYNLCPGRSTQSFGSACAENNGISKEVVRRAEELILLAMRGEDLVVACAVMPAEEAAELQEAENVARAFLTVDFDDASHGDNRNARSVLDEVLTTTYTGTMSSRGPETVSSRFSESTL
ncbi:muts domain V-domain-containing protein [Phyllosticta citribraziliensis]|uniref:Muts domain V-domain-containing protein n=1 Tax=Phyllosticta citribraziliensis TaxID=989973 RepID=A0ABR1LKU4_9PEZI